MKKTIVVLASALFATSVFAQHYKWTDQDGKVRYGDVPPPGANVTPLRSVPRASTPDAPAAPAGKKEEKALTPEQAFRKRQEDAEKEREKQAKANQDAQQKRENCARSQDGLRALESGQRISRTDSKGERYFLDDAEHAQELSKARQNVQQWCG